MKYRLEKANLETATIQDCHYQESVILGLGTAMEWEFISWTIFGCQEVHICAILSLCPFQLGRYYHSHFTEKNIGWDFFSIKGYVSSPPPISPAPWILRATRLSGAGERWMWKQIITRELGWIGMDGCEVWHRVRAWKTIHGVKIWETRQNKGDFVTIWEKSIDKEHLISPRLPDVNNTESTWCWHGTTSFTLWSWHFLCPWF